MQCMHPSLIRNPAWTGEKDSIQSFMVPCGRCIGCRIARTREWAIRCLHESSMYEKNCFLTLTYDDDHIPPSGSLVKKDLQDFLKRLRFHLGDRKIKYFGCGEYGDTTHRPHYHLILFGVSPSERYLFEKCWNFGFNTVGCVTYDSCKYVAGYVQKKLYGKDSDSYDGNTPPFMVCSKHLGYDFVMKNKKQLLDHMSVTVNGTKLALPRYYRKILGIDTEEFYLSTQENRDEVRDILMKRIPDDVPDFAKEYALLAIQKEAIIQYEKNCNARLSLRNRSKV